LRFTVRRPACAEVSPCCHRPSGGDVACSVHVGVARPRVAGFALENRLALTVPGSDVAARGASLPRVRGRDLLNPTESLVLQTRSEATPTTSVDRPVQSAFLSDVHTGLLDGSARTAGHRTHVKSFKSDRIEASGDIGGGLFDPVLASVGLPRLKLRGRRLDTDPSVRATLGTVQALLQHLQSFRLAGSQTRGVQQVPSRQGRRHHDTAVDTDQAAIPGTLDRVGYVGERDMPTAGTITCDPIRLHPLRDRPRHAEANPADLGHPHPTEPATHALDMPRFHTNLPKPLMHARLAPRGAAARPCEKVVHRLSEVPQRLVLHSLRPCFQPVVLGAGCRRLSTLLVIARCAASRLPVQLLLDCQVPNITGVVATMLSQHRLLLSSRKQPISRHVSNVTAAADKTPKGETALAPPATTGPHAVTSQ
jgi:hypothetical protein